MKVAIVGAGIGGLSAAYYLTQTGHQVTIFEADKRIGGLAAGFKSDNWNWQLENYFHHLFTSDKSAINLIKELNLDNHLIWLTPKSSIFRQGLIYRFDSPKSVLRFPLLPLIDRIRTGLITAWLKLIPFRSDLEKITAYDWLKRYYGQKSFKVLWQPLLESKFGVYAPQISMAWFWARIKKRSQRLGYLEGGFPVLVNRLVEEIKKNNGKIVLNTEIKDLSLLKYEFDRILVTTPTQKLFKSSLPPMLGAVNLILELKESFLTDGTYWLNINQSGFPFVAVVEHTNFIDKKHYGNNHILYVGGYYPPQHRYFKMKAKQIFEEFRPYLEKINPKFNQLPVIGYQLSVNRFAQPVIPINYSQIIPSTRTNIPHVYLANMQTIYPYDRGINYAIEQGKKIADEIIKS